MNKGNLTVLITGATSGIGLELAKVFYEQGHPLVLVSRNPQKLRQVRAGFSDPSRVEILTQDLSEPNAALEVFKKCQEMNLTIDVLVNNAGMGKMGEHVDISPASTKDMIQLNVLSLTLLSALFGAEMKKMGRGYILNVGSTAGFLLAPYMATYIASKHFIKSFSISIAKELEDHGVIVRCLCPGPTETSFFEKTGKEAKFFFSPRLRASAEQVAQQGYYSLFRRGYICIPDWRNYLMTLLPVFPLFP